ncbi:MAG: Holliday junction branch migration protein RuvA [Pantoea sp. Brub]|nr:Holliday junction branch migration protein RuvA [Pantoea sp. Brub]
MIGYLRGNIIEKYPPIVLLEVSGVGYEINMPITCLYKLPEINTIALIFTHIVITENNQLLFGFNNRQERDFFKELIKINGVGTKLALAIMSNMSVQTLITSIEQGKISILMQLPHVGKKIAERLIIEMKDHLKKMKYFFLKNTSYIHSDLTDKYNVNTSKVETEAIEALVSLGYKLENANKIITQINKPNVTSETLIREALRKIF